MYGDCRTLAKVVVLASSVLLESNFGRLKAEKGCYTAEA